MSNPALRASETTPREAIEERVAEAIYDAMREDHDGGTNKPWVAGGNSLKQDEARRRARRALGSVETSDTKRLDWWFARGMDDSVCEGSVDLWWATEIDGDATTVVTHGVSVRDALDKAMRGIHDPEDTP